VVLTSLVLDQNSKPLKCTHRKSLHEIIKLKKMYNYIQQLLYLKIYLLTIKTKATSILLKEFFRSAA
jgi:hypothetical protein